MQTVTPLVTSASSALSPSSSAQAAPTLSQSQPTGNPQVLPPVLDSFRTGGHYNAMYKNHNATVDSIKVGFIESYYVSGTLIRAQRISSRVSSRVSAHVSSRVASCQPPALLDETFLYPSLFSRPRYTDQNAASRILSRVSSRASSHVSSRISSRVDFCMAFYVALRNIPLSFAILLHNSDQSAACDLLHILARIIPRILPRVLTRVDSTSVF